MSFVTLEVEISDGRVMARGADRLPARGVGLLTLFPEPEALFEHAPGTMREFIRRWAGAFSVPSEELCKDDARLAYLVGKHLK